jgi:hypothetical protein
MHGVRKLGAIFVSAAALAVVAACSGAVTNLGPDPDGGIGSCSQDSDCGAGKMCGFAVADACQAHGTCFAAPAPGTPRCNAYAPACACDGTTIGIACNGYPNGYASRPVAYTGTCAQTDGGGAACTRDADCGTGLVCAFPISAGCSAIGACVPTPPPGPKCGAYEPACTCGGQTIDIACTGYPPGTASNPILHTGQCEGIDAGHGGGLFACGPLMCDGATQVCKIGVGGPAGAPPSYGCIDYPAQCVSNATCTCVEPAVGAQLCSENGGNFTVTFEYP